MGILLHYMLLASFMWMFLEGFQLYRITLNVFDVWTKRWTIYYFVFAYTVPLIIVGTTVLISSYRPPDEAINKTGIQQVYSGDETYYLDLNITI